MSGIAGIVHFDGAPVARAHLDRMAAAMAYRGPQGSFDWHGGSVAMCHLLLRNAPEEPSNLQPLVDESGAAVLAMDGRVDNRDELLASLLAHSVRLRDRSDAELVLKAYLVWSAGFLERIEGDFALALWHAPTSRILLARDRIGVKPLHFSCSGRSLAFSSDAHALLRLPWVSKAVNERAVAERLSSRMGSSSDTLYADVSRVPAAHLIEVHASSLLTRRYWDLSCGHVEEGRHVDHAERFLDLLDRAVRCRSRSCTKVAAYLSGGLDSSAVTAAASRAHRASGASAPFDTYSLTFPGLRCDESEYISAVARHCGVRSRRLAYRSLSLGFYRDEITRFSDVCISPNGAMLVPLRRLARDEGVGVLLTGYGGDQYLARSPFAYAESVSARKLLVLSALLVEDVRAERPSHQILGDLARAFRPLVPSWAAGRMRGVRRALAARSTPRDFVAPDLAARVCLDDGAPLGQTCPREAERGHAYLHRCLTAPAVSWAFEIEDRSNAQLVLEERHPLYDRRLVEFALKIPDDERSGPEGKRLLREAMRGDLPESVRRRRGKAEFSPTLAHLLTQPEAEAILACPNLVSRGWVDPEVLADRRKGFREAYAARRRSYMYYVWDLWIAFALESWAEGL